MICLLLQLPRQAAAVEQRVRDGEELTTHNGTTSVSLSEGFKPFDEVPPPHTDMHACLFVHTGTCHNLPCVISGGC